MDSQKADFHHELKFDIDESSLLNSENIRKGQTKLNTGKSSNELNGKQIGSEYFESKTIKQEQIYIKSEEEEGDPFITDEFNEKLNQDEYFNSNSIKCEEIEFKTENEEGDEFSTKSSSAESEKGFHPGDSLGNSPMFKCLKCSYQTHKKQLITRHVDGHKPKPFGCPLCPYKCKNKHLLKAHQLVHIPKEEATLHKCPQCQFTSKRGSSLTKHLLIHKKPDEITWYQCSECQFKAKYKYEIKTHILVHRNELPMYKCTLCSYESSSKRNLKRHLHGVHRSKDLPLIGCTKEGCSFKTYIQSYLEDHIRRIHDCQKIFKCSKCLYETRNAKGFRAHQLIHENPDKWFSCPLCPFKTPYRSSITNHSLVHKSDSEIEWFECSECSFKARRKQDWTRHKRKHSPEVKKFITWFHCYMCTYKTDYKQNLAKHIQNKHRDADGCIVRRPL